MLKEVACENLGALAVELESRLEVVRAVEVVDADNDESGVVYRFFDHRVSKHDAQGQLRHAQLQNVVEIVESAAKGAVHNFDEFVEPGRKVVGEIVVKRL